MDSLGQPELNQSNAYVYSRIRGISGWGDFFAIVMIIHGVLISLGVITAVFGVPLIFAGVKLQNAVKASKELTGANDPKLNEVFDNLNSFFKINGVLIIIGIALGVLGLIALIAVGTAAFMSLMKR